MLKCLKKIIERIKCNKILKPARTYINYFFCVSGQEHFQLVSEDLETVVWNLQKIVLDQFT
jgi:hypothetical protein